MNKALLSDQYTRADYGNNQGYGFNGEFDAMSTVDPQDPPLGHTFKISGQVLRLEEICGKLEFVEIE